MNMKCAKDVITAAKLALLLLLVIHVLIQTIQLPLASVTAPAQVHTNSIISILFKKLIIIKRIFLNGICGNCDSSCLTCNSATECLTCFSGY